MFWYTKSTVPIKEAEQHNLSMMGTTSSDSNTLTLDFPKFANKKLTKISSNYQTLINFNSQAPEANPHQHRINGHAILPFIKIRMGVFVSTLRVTRADSYRSNTDRRRFLFAHTGVYARARDNYRTQSSV